MDKNLENLKKCPRFGECSINVCPLDFEANHRNKLISEESCPFTIKKKSKAQKGIRTLALAQVLQFVPESNLKMLNRRSLERYQGIHGTK